MKAIGNPIIRHKYTADPTVLVWQDKIYLYTGRDETPMGSDEYVMNEWLCFSSSDLAEWREHTGLLKATDFKWSGGGAFATKIIHHAGTFYWYVSVNHKTINGTAIGVAVASAPTEKFKDARGTALITRDMLPATNNEKCNLDPAVIIDDDGQAYIFWGNQQCFYAKLGKDMISLHGEIREVMLPGFQEGAHIHKRGEWYYLSYGFGMPEKVAYAMSESVHGPWQFKDILNEIPGNCETNRPCIVAYNGDSYFFYHNGALPDGSSRRRSVCVDRLYYDPDGSMKRVIMTSEGVSGGREHQPLRD